MDPSDVPPSFRIPLQVMRGESNFKCFIFINFNKMYYIKDVEEHIKAVLNIEPISLFVNDVWLPSNETALLIKQEDNLVAKALAFGGVLDETPNEKVAKKKRKKRTSEVLDSNIPETITFDSLYKELLEKQNALMQNFDSTKGIVQEVTDENPLKDDSDLLIFKTNPVKKKRTRKHKKKVTVKEVKPKLERTASVSITKPFQVAFEGTHMRFEHEDRVPQTKKDTVTNNNENQLVDVSTNNAMECSNHENSPSNLSDCNDLIPDEGIYINSVAKIVVSDEVPTNNGFNLNSDIPKANADPNEISTAADNQAIQCDYLSASHLDEPNNESEDWKCHLMKLANTKEVESKIFHRTLPAQETKTGQ